METISKLTIDEYELDTLLLRMAHEIPDIKLKWKDSIENGIVKFLVHIEYSEICGRWFAEIYIDE